MASDHTMKPGQCSRCGEEESLPVCSPCAHELLETKALRSRAAALEVALAALVAAVSEERIHAAFLAPSPRDAISGIVWDARAAALNLLGREPPALCRCGKPRARGLAVTRSGDPSNIDACSLECAERIASRYTHARIWCESSLSPETTSPAYRRWRDEKAALLGAGDGA